MTIDQRLDRAERVLLLMVKAGRRERKRMRDLDEKIAMMINAQIQNEDGFREIRELFRETDRKWQETDRKWQETDRKWQETDRKWQETDRKWQETDRKWQETRRQFREIGDLFRRSDERITRLAETQNRTDRKVAELTDQADSG
jgi:chromosome segregation ATPase